MAIHYNLAKVYAISDDDDDFVRQIITLFVEEVPSDIKQIKEGIEDKDYVKTYGFAHKTKPTLDLLGMDAAKEEILLVEQWTRDQGKKEIKEVYKSLKNRINAALEEVKKDFNL